MSAPTIDVVSENEWLARYILRKDHIRNDGTLKADPFIPYKWVELSVTRHVGLTEAQIWSAGEQVAAEVQNGLLQGRGDAQAAVYMRNNLRVDPAPTESNPCHANVIGWPTEKHLQKQIALDLVRDVRFVPKP